MCIRSGLFSSRQVFFLRLDALSAPQGVSVVIFFR